MILTSFGTTYKIQLGLLECTIPARSLKKLCIQPHVVLWATFMEICGKNAHIEKVSIHTLYCTAQLSNLVSLGGYLKCFC